MNYEHYHRSKTITSTTSTSTTSNNNIIFNEISFENDNYNDNDLNFIHTNNEQQQHHSINEDDEDIDGDDDHLSGHGHGDHDHNINDNAVKHNHQSPSNHHGHRRQSKSPTEMIETSSTTTTTTTSTTSTTIVKRMFEPPKSLQLLDKSKRKSLTKQRYYKQQQQQQRLQVKHNNAAQQQPDDPAAAAAPIMTIDSVIGSSFDLNDFHGNCHDSINDIINDGVGDDDEDLDDDEDDDNLIDYSIYENRTGLAEDMKFLASMPELCDITFLVGEKSREPVCGVKAVLASRSRVFHKLLYGQKQKHQQQQHQQHGHGHHGHHDSKNNKRKDTAQKDSTKLKLFLKRSSEPILNGLPFNQQQPIVQTHQTMIIEEFEPDVFRQLIEYIHTGCVTLQARTLLGLMNAADYYGLEELRRACIGFVTCCITVDTVNSILASAERYIQYKCTKSLVQRVLEFVDKHGNEVLSLGSFALLPEHVVRLILSREELKADELTKFQAALHWSQRSCETSCGTLDLRDVMSNFLECIEFYKIPASILMREVHPLGVVPDHVIMNALAFQADPSSVDIRKVESPNRFRRMTLPHAYNIAGSDLIHLRHTANFWAERAEAANNNPTSPTNVNGPTSPTASSTTTKDRSFSSRLTKRRASKPFKRSKTLMESS